MMNQENNLDKVDKMLFDYFENEVEKPIPQSVYDSIDIAVEQLKNSHKRNYIFYLTKVAVIVVIIGILSTSVVFAKDIVHFISSLFTNSTEAINTAVGNGYVQEVNMDYLFDKDIGIKVEYILLDDTTLDISLIYKYLGNKKINDIYINDFSIENNNHSILWINSEENPNIITEGYKINLNTNNVKLDENCYKSSLLISSNKFSDCDSIILDINSIILKQDKETEQINGNWFLEVPINENKLKRKNIKYNIKENEYVESGFAEMTETSLTINLNLNVNIDKTEIENNIKSFVLYDNSGREYIDNGFNIRNFGDNKSNINIKYDLSKFSENIDNLTLNIVVDNDKKIKVDLYK